MMAVPAAVATTLMAAAMPDSSMTASEVRFRWSSNRRVKEALMMATEIMMFFPSVMDLEAGRIATPAPTIRRVSINGIVGIAVAAPGGAFAIAFLEAPAEHAGAEAENDERLN
jgi:hypothetical protein